MTIITLLTDFGLQDGYVGIMKGVIWGIAPGVQIADISHAVKAQDVIQGALVLRRAVPYFPAGTVHTVVVDPGVGTSRRPLAGRLRDQYFVGPDNGLFSLVLEQAEAQGEIVEWVHLTHGEYWLPQVSAVFHGRDIFASVSAHLANGVPLSALGEPVYDPVRLLLPQPKRTAGGWSAEVMHIDHFGNLATNLRRVDLLPAQAIRIRIKGVEIQGVVQAYGELPPGELVALFDSSNLLSIAIVNGDASQVLQAQIGDPVEVSLPPLSTRSAA
jgi:S-adenosyl-L-methionine hydrolase (adenosine-forming)